MTGNGEHARPGLAPGVRTPVGTMFAALYGELAPHPWRNAEQDAYFLFHERSLGMGWLDDTSRDDDRAGLWGMNDAGEDHPLATPDTSLVAWFQVGVAPVPTGRPLPAQPFLRCAGDAVARMGVLALRAVQVLLPVQGLDVPPRPGLIPSLLTAGWFPGGDPGARTPVRVTLDGGQDPAVMSAAPRVREWLNELDQDVFRCASHAADGHDPLAERPPFDDRFWNGPPRHRVTCQGTLAEWTPDALGWLGGFLADLSARAGVASPLLLTVTRS